jgi:outer membrane protein assembly factor BamB
VAAERMKKQFLLRNVWVSDTLSAKNTGFRKINRMSPLVYDQWLVQGNSIDGISLHDSVTGREVWKVLVRNGVESPGLVFKKNLYVGGNDGKFYSIHLPDGKGNMGGTIDWVIDTKTENLGEPTLDTEEGILYFQNALGTLYAVEAAVGRIVWTYNRQDTNQFSIRGNSKPTVVKDMVLNGFSDGSLVAFQKSTGSIVWEAFLNKNKRFKDVDSTPLVDGDNVYVQAFDEQLYAVSLADGLVRWKSPYGGYYGVFIDQNRIYASTTDGHVVALNKKSGELVWKYSDVEGIPTQVKSYKGLIVFGESSGSLKFLDTNRGQLIDSYEPGRGILSIPTVDAKNSRVYFISNEGNLYAMEALYSDRGTFYAH